MYNTYVECNCVRRVRRGFLHKFQDNAVPNRKIIHTVLNKLRQMGSLLDEKKVESKCQILMEGKLYDISTTLEYNSRISLGCLAQVIRFQKCQHELPQNS
jgi:hypothetical protein